MITDLVVENYQAVKEARLRLGRFTVVTGPTGSGKSAVIRALKMVVNNQRGTAFIRAGAKSCQAAVGFEDEQTVVSITRGKGADAYRVVTPSGDELSASPRVQVLTKLAGGVPEDVSAILRLSDVNFAGQLDPMFLLTSSGGDVARRLGELTNVTLLLEAAREANRRRLEVSAALKREQARLAALKEHAARFAGLREQREAMAAAERTLGAARELEKRRNSLALRVAALELAEAQAAVAAVPPEIPSVEGIAVLVGKRSRLQARLAAIADLEQFAGQASDRAGIEAAAEERARTTLHRELADAGRCPTCGQAVDPMKLLAVKLFGDGSGRSQ